MIYLDACAIVKLVRAEDGSEALAEWLSEWADRGTAAGGAGGVGTAQRAISSELVRAEVARAVRRANHDHRGELVDAAALARELSEAADVLAAMHYLAVDRAVLVRAGELVNPMIRTLDAIHLVSAQSLGALVGAFISYDERLAAAARDSGLTVVAPM